MIRANNKRWMYLLCVLFLLGVLGACQRTDPFVMEMAFELEQPVLAQDSQDFRVKEDQDVLKLNGQVRMTEGKASVQVLDAQSGDVLWEKDFTENVDFEITLDEPKADKLYRLEAYTMGSQTFSLRAESKEGLIIEDPTQANSR